MILATLVWLYASLLSLAYGLALIALLRRAWRLADESAPLAVVCLTGLAVVAALVMALSLFVPIGLFANLVLLAGALAAAALLGSAGTARIRAARERWRSASPVVKVIAAGAFLVALERTTERPLVGDTGVYHAQAIRWVEELGVVPGLGNLHARFAIDSAWFALEALFGLSFLGFGHLHALNGWLCLCLVSFLLLGVDDLLAGRRTTSAWAKLILLVCLLPLVAGWISSPTPDLAIAAVLWVALLLACDVAESERGFAVSTPALALAVLSAFAPLIKPSAAPVALLLFPVIAAAWRVSRPRAALLLALVAAMSIPLELRQLVISGYPIFLVASLDPFDFDWQMPRSAVVEIAEWIRSWARMPARPPSEVLLMWPTEWLPSWLARLRNADGVLLLAIPLCAGILGARRLLRAKSTPPTARLWVDATLVAGVAYWFALAPDPRFGIGFYPALSAVLIARAFRPVLARVPAPAIAGALCALLAAEIGVLYRSHPEAIAGLASRVARPAVYPTEPTVQSNGANFTVAIPRRSDRCWYEPFPCTPYAPGARVELRGEGWRSGFRATDLGHSQ